MTSPIITIKPDADIREAARILDERRIKRLPRRQTHRNYLKGGYS